MTDDQIEVEAYPRFWKGTYFYLAAAVAPHPVIYPRKRFAADIYQTLGAGWEASVGERTLHFSDSVQVHTAALAKYAGNWMHAARAWVTPHAGSNTVTIDLSTRRYRAAGESYWGLRYARGNYRDDLREADFERLHSNTATFEFNQRLGRTYVVGFATVSREDQTGNLAFWQTSAGLTFRVRF